jgi:hypothetical protein
MPCRCGARQPSSLSMETCAVEQDWQLIRSLLPSDLEVSARETGALRRRRGVASADVLLRLAMAYAYCGLSLRAVAAWAARVGLAQLCDVALLNRLRNAAPWFGRLLTQKLAERGALPSVTERPLRLRLVDATSLSRSGSHGTDFRLHLGFDLAAMCIDHAELTSASGGETLTRHPLAPGEVVIGDRGYAHRPGIVAVARAGAEVLVRLNWHNVPLEHPDGQPFDVLGAVRSLQVGEVGEWRVRTAPDPKGGLEAVEGRVTAVRKSEAAAEQARRKRRADARRQGRTPDARSLEAAAYVFLFTTLSAERLSAPEVLALYRFRWQVELVFKRLKGIVALDELAARDPDLCRSFVLVKLLAMLILEDLAHGYMALSPWGYGRPAAAVAVAALPQLGRDAAPRGGTSAHSGPVARPHRSLRPHAARHATPPAKPGSASALPTGHLSNALPVS